MSRFLAVFALTAVTAAFAIGQTAEIAQASTITVDLLLTPTGGDPIGGTGSLTVENYTGVGSETFNVSPGGGLDSLTFNIGGSNFSLANAVFGGASVSFEGDALTSISYFGLSGLLGGSLQFLSAGGDLAYIYNTSATSTNGAISAAPLPGALPLFASGLGGIGLVAWLRKRKHKRENTADFAPT